MREIKFRGRRIDGNGYAYGDLQHKCKGKETWIDGWQVFPNTVRQFIGYDAARTEVYEGDKVNVYHGFCIPAKDLKTKTPRMKAKVELIAEVQKVYEDLNSPFDYQFMKV
jgi:hypothetical protein